ncbi:hypothetical protein [Acinetobacter sp. UBA2581]|uniref:hypothetical protein n=1 Tax=Acinetobacter sp. UBA2581 TaxID=1945932 RepID=UPI00257EC0B6|nr:hypothetical protein [Acinetobacter sp. UBA2581]
MDILEEIDVFFSACQLTQDESNNLVFNGMTGCFESKYLADWFVNQINFGWKLWQAAKAQAVPEGFVLVKKELPEQIAEKMAIDRIDKPRHENDPVWSEIAEQSYKDQVKSKKWEFWRDYKAMIEAQEPANADTNS